MPGLDKTKQNWQPAQEVNGEKNTTQSSSNVSLLCMQINTMEIIFIYIESNYFLNNPLPSTNNFVLYSSTK